MESGGSGRRRPYTVTVVPENGFDQAVTLSASGLPANNVMAAFDPATLTAPYPATSTLTLTTNGASVGTRTVTIAGTGGGLSRTDSVELVVVPQPTTYRISPSEGYAGAHTVQVTVGNGANMGLHLRYTLNEVLDKGTIPLDANGQWSYISTRADVVGTYVYTGMKNALLSKESDLDWVPIDATYIVLPPKPTTMSINPSSLDLPGSYRMTVGNGADMTLDVQYKRTPPGETDAGPEETIANWPDLIPVAAGSLDGTAVIPASGCTLPGVYLFTKMRNALHERDEDWVGVSATVTNRAPVSVTSVVPTSIVAGSRVRVTLTGEHLCALELSTTYPGVSISEVSFDPPEGDGTMATAMIEVAATAAGGTATVEVRAGGGTTSFELTIGPPPSFTITASRTARYVAPSSSATYTVTVVPVSGFAQDVELSVGENDLPANVTAEFSPSSLSAPYTSTSTLTLTTNGASVGTRTVTLTGTAGGLSPTASVELVVVAQPTSFQFSAAAGYAGTDTMTATVGGATGMRVELRFTVDGGPENTYTLRLNARGQWHYRLPRSQFLGPYGEWVFTGIRNARLSESELESDWVPVHATYTVLPPQPTTMSISPSELTPPGSYTMTVGNGSRLTLDVQYTLTPPGGTTGPVQTIENWPALTAAGGDNGRVVIAAGVDTPPGVYRFTAMRNTLNTAWVPLDPPVEVTIRSLLPPDFTITATPESRTVESGGSATETTYTVTVVPELGFAQDVTLSASGLPANLTAAFDPEVLSSPYTDSTLTLRVAALSTAGTTELTVTGTGGSLSRTGPVELVLVPQPTTYQMTPDEGHAGAHTVMATVGNGANMSLELRYTLNGVPKTGKIQLDASGQWSHISTRDDVIGTYVYTGMRNALLSEWVTIDETYTVLPPQPTTMSINPSSLALPGRYTMTVGNGAGMTLDVQYTRTPPGATAARPVQTIENWPVLNAAAAGSADGTAVISASGCTLPGVYLFTKMRNTLNAPDDDETEENWVDVAVTVTNSAPVSVTSVSPPNSLPPPVGGSAVAVPVTITGKGLCALSLTTTYTGLTISNLVFDGVVGEGTSATATFTIAPGTLPGIAEIAVRAGGGSTTFDFVIGTAPTELALSAAATAVTEDPDAEPVSGAPANAGQSVAVTVTVIPAPPSGTSYTGCNIRAVAADTTAGTTDYSLPTSGGTIAAIDSWSKTFIFWVIDDTEDDDDETLVLEAFCTGRDTAAPPPVAHDALVSAQLAFLITDNDQASGQSIYFKRDHIYAGPGGARLAIVTPTPTDPTAPASPTGLAHSNLTATSVQLSWTTATDTGGAGMAGYKIYRGNVPVGTTTATSFTDPHLKAQTAYSYTVRAFDNAQNHSPASTAVSFTTPAAPAAPQE